MKVWWLLLGLILGFGLFELSIHYFSFTGNGLLDPWIWIFLLILGIVLTFTPWIPFLNTGRELLIGALIGFIISTYFLNPGFFFPSAPQSGPMLLRFLSGGIV